MGTSSPTPGSQPVLQPGERISGPLPPLDFSTFPTPAAPPSPAPEPVSPPVQRRSPIGNMLGAFGGALAIVAMFLPTYLAQPFATLQPGDCCSYYEPLYSSLTGVQVLFGERSMYYSSGWWLWVWQALAVLAAINVLAVASDRVRNLLLKMGKLLVAGGVFLACAVGSQLFYALPFALGLFFSLRYTLRASEERRIRLKLAWPVVGMGALVAGTAQFFSQSNDTLAQLAGSDSYPDPSYHYTYLTSLGPGAWLTFAGLLTALLGAVLVAQASKQVGPAVP